MHRRAFLIGSLLALAAPRGTLAVTPVTAPRFAMRAFAALDPDLAHLEHIVARVDRLTEVSPRFPSNLDELIELGHFVYLGAMRGEYYVGEADAVPAPEGLPDSAVFADFVSRAGVAAFRQEHTLGMVESGSFRWTLQATGGSPEARIRLVTDLALLLVDRHSIATSSPRVDTLSDLLPTPEDIPFPVCVTEELMT